MQCEEVQAILSLEEASQEMTNNARLHLASCDKCKGFFGFLRGFQESLNTLLTDEPRPELAERIRARCSPPVRIVETTTPVIYGSRNDRKDKNKMPRILAVDDEPNIVRLMQVNLERQGYQVETANNGVQALEKIRANRPDLLVSDVMMPEMDGFELLSTIRRDPSLESLPVIMLTAKAQDSNVMEGYSRGADMYLTKPFNPQELLQFVKRILTAAQEDDGGAYRL